MEIIPDRIIVEYNGMWEISLMEQEFPRSWEIYQIVTTINAETYEIYLKNMGPKIIEQVGVSELVVFNRCTPKLNEMIRTTNVKAMNPRAIIFLEDRNGNAEDYSEGMPLPFDIDAPVIDITDDDFGTWYVDAMNDPAKYDGKTVKVKVQLHRRPTDADNRFIAGRFAMSAVLTISALSHFTALWIRLLTSSKKKAGLTSKLSSAPNTMRNSTAMRRYYTSQNFSPANL